MNTQCTLRGFCLFFYKYKSGAAVSIPLYLLTPHACRSDPQALLAVKRLVNNHRLQCFRVGCDTDHAVFVSFEMSVFSYANVHSLLLIKMRRGNPGA